MLMVSRSLLWVAFWVSRVDAGTINVVMIHNAMQLNVGWKDGFLDFFVRFLNTQGGFTITGDDQSPYFLNASLCEFDIAANGDPNTTLSVQSCLSTAGDVDVIVVGTSTGNDDIKQLGESLQIPNLHCSGGNPAQWTGATPHAFGIHLPFPWYSRGPMRRAALQGLRRVVIIRNYDWGFPRTSAVAAAEWSLESSMTLIGPSLKWCQQWANMTQTCRIINSSCRCGEQAEFDALGYKYEVASMPSYEVSEDAVVEAGLNPRNEIVSPALIAFVEGIIDDVRRQGQDPDVVVNWLTSARSGLVAMRQRKFAFQMYFGGPNVEGIAWNGYESYWQNGTVALGTADALYNMGGGQWHHGMLFSDPFFGSSSEMVRQFSELFERPPSYDAAACTSAGIALALSLQRYGRPLPSSIAARREEIRLSIGNLNDETLFGTLRFNRFNQNNGRLTVSWQVLEDGTTQPVLPAEAASTEFRFPAPSWEVRLGCPSGSYAAAITQTDLVPKRCSLCPEGTYRSLPSNGLVFSVCQQCELGTGLLPGVTGATSCSACPAGREQRSEAHRGICHKCPTGQFRAANGSDKCELCPAGTYADEEGLAECKVCAVLSSQPDVGQAACLCDVGSFRDQGATAEVADGTLACTSCEDILPGSTTRYPGSISPLQCLCPAGRFWHRPSPGAPAWCKACGVGLDCRGGFTEENATGQTHQPPMQTVGFSAGVQEFPGADPSYVVSCENLARCPGGPLGRCPDRLNGRGCATCTVGSFDDGSGCTPCTDLAVWPVLVSFMLVVAAMFVLYQYSMGLEKPHRESMMTLTVTAGLAVMAIQTLSAFTRIELEWIEPLYSLRSALSILAFDIGFLRPQCWVGGVDPLLEYGMAISAYPLCALCLLMAFAFNRLVRGKNVSIYQVVNTQGLLVSALYIALTYIALQPFQCIQNPDGSATLVAYRGLTCWDNRDHTVMVVLSAIPLLGVVVAYMALVSWATWRYPIVCRAAGGVDFVKRWSFLFTRFQQHKFYFAWVLAVRNLMVGLSPIVFVDLPAIQLVLLHLTVATYGSLAARVWPWRTQIANILDVGLCFCLLLVVSTGQLLLKKDQENEYVVQVLLLLFLAVAVTGLTLALAVSAMRLVKTSHPYGVFISHHKKAAGTLARWFKMLLAERISDKVFLDSDDVDRLETIIDITGAGTQNLLVLLTSETLKRIWCAAEIASSWGSGTNIVQVACDGCVLTHECIDAVPGAWTEEQQTTLANIGISFQSIKDAYMYLLSKAVITLDRRGAEVAEHERAIQIVLAQCKGLSRNMQRVFSPGTGSDSISGFGTNPKVLMLGDIESSEPGSCCRVMQVLLQAQLEEEVQLLNPSLAVLDMDHLTAVLASANVILVVLTQGVLELSPFAACVTACALSNAELIPVKAEETFLYPDPVFYEKLMAADFFQEKDLVNLGTDLSTVKATYGVLFNMLALKFTSHGTERIQATEVHLMCGRILPLLHAEAVSSISPSNHSPSRSGRRNSGRDSRRSETIRLSIRESARLHRIARDSNDQREEVDEEIEEYF